MMVAMVETIVVKHHQPVVWVAVVVAEKVWWSTSGKEKFLSGLGLPIAPILRR